MNNDELLNALDYAWVDFHNAIADLREYARAAEAGLQILGDERAAHEDGQQPEPDIERDLSALHHHLMVARSVDLFLVFVRDSLRAFASWRPHAFLAEDDRVPARQVFDALDLSALREELLHERVERLSRRGFKEIAGYLQKRLSLSFELTANEAQGIADAVAARNCIVHNSGHVDDQFRLQTGRLELTSGQDLPLDDWSHLVRPLQTATHSIYRAMAVKAGSTSPHPMSRWFGDAD